MLLQCSHLLEKHNILHMLFGNVLLVTKLLLVLNVWEFQCNKLRITMNVCMLTCKAFVLKHNIDILF